MNHREYIVPIGDEAEDYDEIFIGVLRKHKELIRCKDCIRWRRSKSDTTAMVCDWDSYERTENDYCSWAKRRDDDTD